MHVTCLRQRRIDSLRGRLVREIIARRPVKNISAQHDAVSLTKAVVRIPDLRNVLIGPRDTAVDIVVLLPEAPRLKRDANSRRVIEIRNLGLVSRREVVRYRCKNCRWNRHDAEVGIDRRWRAEDIVVHDTGATGRFSNLGNDGFKNRVA